MSEDCPAAADAPNVATAIARERDRLAAENRDLRVRLDGAIIERDKARVSAGDLAAELAQACGDLERVTRQRDLIREQRDRANEALADEREARDALRETRDRLAAENAILRRQLEAAAAAMFPRMRSENAKLEAERDRYRKALEAMAERDPSALPQSFRDIAREALEAGQ